MNKTIAAFIFLLAIAPLSASENYNSMTVQGTLSPVQDILDVKVDVLANGSVVGSSDTVNLLPDANGFFTVFVHNVDPSLFGNSNTEFELLFSTGNGAYEVLRLPLTSVPFAKALKGAASTDNLIGAKGNIGIGTTAAAYKLDVTGDAHFTSSVTASKFYGDGSGLTGLSTGGDNLGNHAATTTLNMSGYGIANAQNITFTGAEGGIILAPFVDNTLNYSYRHGVSIGSGTYDNYNGGVGVGRDAGTNHDYAVGIGNNAYNNRDLGIGVGAYAHDNYNVGIGVGYFAFNNSGAGVGLGYFAHDNYNRGVGIGDSASGNYEFGVGIGAGAANNSYYAVGIGAYSRNNGTYGSALGAYSYAAPSSVALGSYARANAGNSVAVGAGTVNNSTGAANFGVYAIVTSSDVTAAKYYGDGSALTGIRTSDDNLGNHTATMDLSMANFNITVANSISGASAFFSNGVTASSFIATGAALGVDTAKLRFTDSNIILSSASPSQYGGLYTSTHVYVNGDLYAPKIYGDGSGLTALNASNLASGIVADSRLSTNVNLLNANQTVTGVNTFTSSVTIAGSAVVSSTLTVQSIMPDNFVGGIMYFAKSNCPNGFLKANGAAVSRTTYAKLFAAIGTTFGAGDGATTFNVPDMRGEFVRGLDNGRGVDYSADGAPRISAETRSRNIALMSCIKY